MNGLPFEFFLVALWQCGKFVSECPFFSMELPKYLLDRGLESSTHKTTQDNWKEPQIKFPYK